MAAKIMRQEDQEQLEDDLQRYLDLLKEYEDHFGSEEELELWKYHTLVKLMEEFETEQDEQFIQNAMIMVNVLMKITPADLYDSRGKDVFELSGEEKKKCFDMLVRELWPN